MDYAELKELVLGWVKDHPEHKERAIQELMRAKIAYDGGINLVDELNELKTKGDLADGYLMPAIIGLYPIPGEIAPIELKQVKPGGGGGLDIDTDVSTAGKPKVKEYLEKKYGKDRVCSVGTFTTVGMASAIKDILRKEEVPFAESNKFCSQLDNELSFAENMEKYRTNFPDLYALYEKYQTVLDFVPRISNFIRGCGKHAGGIMVLDKPVYECVPVVRPQGEIATAFTESGSSPQLDDLGFVKYDILAISQLDIIDDALNMAEEDGFFQIEDDDGIMKIVSKAYLLEKGMSEEEIAKIV